MKSPSSNICASRSSHHLLRLARLPATPARNAGQVHANFRKGDRNRDNGWSTSFPVAELAAWAQHFEIVARNFRCRAGEIDLVALGLDFADLMILNNQTIDGENYTYFGYDFNNDGELGDGTTTSRLSPWFIGR